MQAHILSFLLLFLMPTHADSVATIGGTTKIIKKSTRQWPHGARCPKALLACPHAGVSIHSSGPAHSRGMDNQGPRHSRGGDDRGERPLRREMGSVVAIEGPD